jgi:hypothetical protein
MRPALPSATERLTFRLWRPDDHELAEALWGDARVTALIGGPFDAAAAHRLLIERLPSRLPGLLRVRRARPPS